MNSGDEYSGEWSSSGKRHGFGVCVFAASSFLYEGYWREDKPHGRGRLILNNLKVIESTFIDGLFVRKWTDDGNEYEGNCNLNLQAHGKCRVKHRKGDCYDGDWNDGHKHGQGLYILNDGPTFQSRWIDDKLVEYKMLVDGAYYEGSSNEFIPLPFND